MGLQGRRRHWEITALLRDKVGQFHPLPYAPKNEFCNCLIYFSHPGSADLLRCVLIAPKVEQFFMF